MNLHDRAEATRATVERYRGKPFDWSAGITCAHMARVHLRNMGHRPPAMPRFRSALGARRALKELGHASLGALIDSLPGLAPIAPAQMLVGDLYAVRGEGGLDAVWICAGPRRVFGWIEGEAETVMVEPTLADLVGVWRV